MPDLVDHFKNGFDGAKAYRAANYRVKNGNVAKVEASKILTNPNVQSYLMWKLPQITARDDTQVDEGRLICESNALAYASLTDVLSWDKDGRIRSLLTR
ncbi:MAG: terminase small subunit [Gammaproteobacteria bacterium]